MASDRDPVRQLTQVDMVYRPGERALAARVFELLGLHVLDNGGPWLIAQIDPSVAPATNACFASEMTPEQWELEQALATVISGDGAESHGAASAASAYVARMQAEPQHSNHFGIRVPDRVDFDSTLERIRAAQADPDLAGRVTISGVHHPDDPGAVPRTMIQAFVRTDVVAAGLLAFGQHFELQWPLSGPTS